MTHRPELTPADILPWAEYARDRAEHRRRITAIKRHRRIEVGPYVTFYFESFETMWLQVQEMLHIEKGGPDQIADEIAAYNPLVPKGRELVATFMIEIDDPLRRARVLAPPEAATGRVRLKLCRQDGAAESRLVTRREGDVLGQNQSGGRSSLRLLRVTRDGELIAQARGHAEEILNQDPTLVAHPGLAAALARRLDEHAASYLQKG